MPSLRPLSLLETRVLGVLVEKESTVADTYPLSLKALTAGCNQKNNRDPVLDVSETEVQAALDALRSLSFIIESSGSRVMRYSHNMAAVLRVSSEAVALLATLMLRGQQTAGELRAASERLHRFADTASVEGYLHQLAARAVEQGGPLVTLLPRAAGTREARWAHLLSGEVTAATSNSTREPVSLESDEIANLREEIAELRQQLATLDAAVETLRSEMHGRSETSE